MTGLLKLLAVVPLVCVTAPTLTDAPVVVKVATRAVRSVPNGTVTAIVLPLSLTVPLPSMVKAVIALAGLAATLTDST